MVDLFRKEPDKTTRKAPSHTGCSKITRDRAGLSSAFRRKDATT